PGLALLVISIALLAASFWLSRKAGGSASITVYCAANLKKPVEAIAEQYRQELGIEVRLQYGGTGTLLSQIQLAKQGDLFIAADDGSLNDAKRLGCIREVILLVVQHPVIAVKKGNAVGVHSLADLMKPSVKLAIPNPDAASIGKVTRKLLATSWDGLAAKAVVMKPSVSEVAADVQLGAVDATFVWDSTIPQFKELEAIEVPELTKHRENASVAVLAFSKQAGEALKFARYLAAADKGGLVFMKQGFKRSD
ncbi:MAG: hypothetical protein JWO89_2208, partial [Verrucomicrobiaceae bacterium]|nr:hypothetical protein [Verrucomicrobiaceae bacterium]